jgi:hypothetical protein
MKTPKRTPVLGPIREKDIRIKLRWKANKETRAAIKRQAKIMGYATSTAYLT